MVSDTLSDAVFEIRNYLERQPEVYAPWRDRLERCLGEMDAIRRELDTPPGVNERLHLTPARG